MRLYHGAILRSARHWFISSAVNHALRPVCSARSEPLVRWSIKDRCRVKEKAHVEVNLVRLLREGAVDREGDDVECDDDRGSLFRTTSQQL
jgi:hypothetical protein